MGKSNKENSLAHQKKNVWQVVLFTMLSPDREC